MLIGSHVSMSGKEMLLGAAQQAASYQANVFMIYTGAPQNTRRKDIKTFKIQEGYAFMQEHGIEFFTVHAPYIINLANTTKEGYHDFAIEFLRSEMDRAETLGAPQITLHPGSHLGIGSEAGIKQIIKGLNGVLSPNDKLQISLETMAGKGTEIGKTFEELADIISGVSHNDKLSVTFDTCHVYDAGYDLVNGLDDVLNEFDKIIGIDRLKVLHVNDSKNPMGSHKDRHANLGMGSIGFEALNKIVHHPQLVEIPKILETPWVPIEENSKNKKAPYLQEIQMLRQQRFNENFLEEVIQA